MGMDAPTGLSPGNKPGAHCIGHWVGPRSGGETKKNRQIISHPDAEFESATFKYEVRVKYMTFLGLRQFQSL